MDSKLCKYCGIAKSISDFYKRAASKDGLGFKCKKCSLDYGANRYIANRQHIIQKSTKWNSDNKERRRQIVKKSDDKHIDVKRHRGREYSKLKRKLNPELERAKSRNAAHIRRLRMSCVDKNITAKDIRKILDSSNGFCVYCGKESMNNTLDHVSPISRGGGHTLENIIPCCRSCNSSKNTRPVEDWVFDRYGVEGLARAIMYLEKSDFTIFCNKAIHGIEIKEV
jgi:5-methylcytosine-specific restriction endonuclease McrA